MSGGLRHVFIALMGPLAPIPPKTIVPPLPLGAPAAVRKSYLF
jgi:hypothetical protein